MRKRLLTVIALVAFPSVVFAQADAPKERRPNFPISIANPAPSDATRNGQLFKKVDQLSISKSEAGFVDSLASDVTVYLHPKATDLAKNSEISEFFAVLLKDCQGPYSIDEAVTWVQTSWVCHVGQGRSIKNYFTFRDSPELAIEFTFLDGKIKKVFAADLLPLPFAGNSKYLPMTAAETIPDKR